MTIPIFHHPQEKNNRDSTAVLWDTIIGAVSVLAGVLSVFIANPYNIYNSFTGDPVSNYPQTAKHTSDVKNMVPCPTKVW